MSAAGTRPLQASAAREVAYPVEDVWRAMATLLPYCSVCAVSTIVDTPGALRLGTEFRAFPGRIQQTTDDADVVAGGMPGEIGGMPGEIVGMPGEIVEWSPRRSVATRLKTGGEDVVVRVGMTSASPDTTLVTISVEMTPLLRGRLAAAMTRSSFTRIAKRTVEGEIEKLPAHLALLEEDHGQPEPVDEAASARRPGSGGASQSTLRRPGKEAQT